MPEQTPDEAARTAREIAESAEEKAATAKELAKEAADATHQVLQEGADETLQFLGIPIDSHTLTQLSIDMAVKVALALLIFFVGKWIGKRIVRIAKHLMMRSRMDATAATFIGNLLYGLMLVAVILAALNKLGVNTNSFVAVLGAAGVAIGLSLRDQLSNLAAGVLIVIFRPFSRGDFVEVGGQTGTVIDITLVNTRIQTANNHEVIIPNGDIMTSASINYTSLPTRRVDINVGISYDADIREARAVLLKLAKDNPNVLIDPEPAVIVTALADSSVNISLRVWATNTTWWRVQCELLEGAKYALDEAGIGIPYPQRTVQIQDMDKLTKALQINSHVGSQDNQHSAQSKATKHHMDGS